MNRFLSPLICLGLFGVSTHCSALEVLATFPSYSGTITLQNNGSGGTLVPGISGVSGGQNYFSSVSFAAGAAGGGMTSVTQVAANSPTFNGITNTNNGNPTTSGGSYLALTLSRNTLFQNTAIPIRGIWLAPYLQTANSSSVEFHMYSSLATTGTGAGTPTGTWATAPNNSTGTATLQFKTTSIGYQTAATAAPASASYFSFDQLNIIPTGTAGDSFEIRIAMDKLIGNPTGFVLAPFTSILDGPGTGNTINLGTNAMFVIVTPEPGTYILTLIGVLAVVMIESRRRRAKRLALGVASGRVSV